MIPAKLRKALTAGYNRAVHAWHTSATTPDASSSRAVIIDPFPTLPETMSMPETATFNAAPEQLSGAPTTPIKAKVCLIAIDGWGISPADGDPKGDAIKLAKTPTMTHLREHYPYTTLAAHGLAVGLPDGLMGNSEVGHLNIGAGRVVYQDIVRIDLSVQNETIGDLEHVKAAFEYAKSHSGRLHFLGLISDGGVHSHQNHLHALLKAARKAGVPECYVHFFGDGRDTAPKSATTYVRRLMQFIRDENEGYGVLSTMTGRYYAMDRDKRWERLERALNGLLKGEGEHLTAITSSQGATQHIEDEIVKAVEARYDAGETDEFLKPLIIDNKGVIGENDTLFFFNYRSDRMRQLVASLDARCQFSPLAESMAIPKGINITTMTQYKADFPFPTAFPPQVMDNVLAEVLAKHNVPQCHVAETEKYAHVTFFFNGGCEKQFAGEDRVLIPSPRVATYDLQPEMSAAGVGQAVAAQLATGKYPLVMCNFANPDMVGHTGKLEPAVKAVEATDAAIGVIAAACKQYGYTLVITADHGNAEKMIAPNGEPHTAHTTARVPLSIMTIAGVSDDRKVKDPTNAKSALCDVAPTVLDLMGIEVPKEMDGKSVLA
ncbi:2,3-bisphosphoglycerate-independent phosphoglycerate mutase [Allomyces macrogynus ATCC 38327]|uniref:phosphoglycerate mutase (2,3-diphosphoglycerate-independent) n=2 Tax=Allomyces macrogynus (strain ATCC 38327) TaxID=578462 RepID=A0A0L0SL79_ALLM3|nr:2,3-bisphosphoglycerate-independent phosphoglycerate mutase [Allomyces macrogynus ATCC 38327]|eukprot:KNE63135.1 2,3-bisphosphoglycerate-independent phosphoglycerate mutase [Allomyces macrogynus ATCC 38327]